MQFFLNRSVLHIGVLLKTKIEESIFVVDKAVETKSRLASYCKLAEDLERRAVTLRRMKSQCDQIITFDLLTTFQLALHLVWKIMG